MIALPAAMYFLPERGIGKFERYQQTSSDLLF